MSVALQTQGLKREREGVVLPDLVTGKQRHQRSEWEDAIAARLPPLGMDVVTSVL